MFQGELDADSDWEPGNSALVGELFGGEGSVTCSLELEIHVLNK